ncbi:MAG TPA: alpha-amylase family glycosyl hydrolase [Opitutales bacterium]|nr:alpha-amylase family glycosyl hydrolase [Opitutales bacterium]
MDIPFSDDHKFLRRAFWETPDRAVVVLKHDWADQAGPLPLFWDEPGNAIERYERVPPRRYGEWVGYYVEQGWLYFLLRPEDYPNVKFPEERIFVSGDFNSWEGEGDPNWELHPETLDGKLRYYIRLPPSACFKDRQGFFKFVTSDGHWLEPSHMAPNRATDANGSVNLSLNPERTGAHVFYFFAPEAHNPLSSHRLWWIDEEWSESCPIDFKFLLFQAGTDLELGAMVDAHKQTTTFRLFAPRASVVTLEYSKSIDRSARWYSLELEPVAHSVWEAVVSKDLSGAYYGYKLEGDWDFFDPQVSVLDPYAKASVGPQGPGIIVGPSHESTRPKPFHPPAWHDLIMVEGHVRDLIAKAPIKMKPDERLGFSGLRAWVRDTSCYLRKLGINAIELQPIQQFDGGDPDDYHWGYMPVNYFAPTSHYALNPHKASGVEEMRELVDAFHEAGIAVIIDVVYNHLGNPNPLYLIDRDYYFETNPDGTLTNWSGCGNDLRTHTPMARRLIIDSLKHWVKTFGVDGFRFDLAELISVDVLRDVETALKAIKPSVILIAEPWSFRGHIGFALRSTGFCSWNDGYRDFLPKYVCGEGNVDGLAYFMGGSTGHLSAWAAQSLNYTESHDDFAWIDRITQNAHNNGDWPTAQDISRTHLMFAILMASLGVPMISAGQDFMRSKLGNFNTYQRGDLNALDYDREARFAGTHAYVSSWTRWRLSHKGNFMRFDGRPSAGFMRVCAGQGNSAVALLYNADGALGARQVLFAVNPHSDTVEIALPGIKPQQFKQIADHERFDANGLEDAWLSWCDDKLRLPPLSCGLWETL